jgi:hypothetical protein
MGEDQLSKVLQKKNDATAQRNHKWVRKERFLLLIGIEKRLNPREKGV